MSSARPAGPGEEQAARSSSTGRASSPPPSSTAPREPATPSSTPTSWSANATKGPDGRWSRLHHPSIYDHAKTAGYIYEAHLRHELSHRLCVQWQPLRNGIAEIEGFSDSHLREFSTRRQQILEAAGPEASARARQVANLTTREAKEKDLTRETLRQRWRDKAQEIGLDKETLERSFDPEALRRVQAPAVARTVSTEQVGRAVTAGGLPLRPAGRDPGGGELTAQRGAGS